MEQVTVRDVVLATGGRLLAGEPSARLAHIRFNSKEVGPGDLFVPLIGERVDAHRFLSQAAAAGAAAVLTSEHETAAEALGMGLAKAGETKAAADGTTPGRKVMEVAIGENAPDGKGRQPGGTAVIRVEDTKLALQALGHSLRERLSLPLVGVTGSVGKTTTRELIAAALSARYRVYKTPGNRNSQVGVPVTLSEIKAEDEIGVIELGMSEPGELTVIARLAQIDTAVITNIGDAHIEQFGSRERIFKEKMTIQDGLRAGGLLILNGDDELLRGAQAKDGVRTVYYGTDAGNDYRAEDIVLRDGKPEFTAVHGSERCPVRLEALGRHNVLNALAGIAVCAEYGMTLEEAARGLLTFGGFAHRQQLTFAEITGKHVLLLDDSYNASPASLHAALDVFCRIRPGARHIAVLADMKELGDRSPEFHREAGEYAAASGVSLILTLGDDCAYLAEGVRAVSEIPVMEFADIEALSEYLECEVREGDLLLLKGSNSMGLTRLADRIAGGG